MNDFWATIAGASISAASLAITTLMVVLARRTGRIDKQTGEINDAVNHRHESGTMTPRLFDQVVMIAQKSERLDQKTDELIEWKRGYDGGPLDTGEKLRQFVGATVEHLRVLDGKIEQIHERVTQLNRTRSEDLESSKDQ